MEEEERETMITTTTETTKTTETTETIEKEKEEGKGETEKGEKEKEKEKENNIEECPICLEDLHENSPYVIGCASQHTFHVECLKQHIMTKAIHQAEFDIKCPTTNCSYHLIDFELRDILNMEYEKFIYYRETNIPKGKNDKIQVEDPNMREYIVGEGLVQCPNCGIFIEHTGGCVRMRCRCGGLFCTKCFQPECEHAGMHDYYPQWVVNGNKFTYYRVRGHALNCLTCLICPCCCPCLCPFITYACYVDCCQKTDIH